MAINKFLDPKNDFAFKRIFGTERNKDILVHFLNDMLEFSEGEKIKDVSFLKLNQDPEIAYKKQSIVDVLCTDEKERKYIIEMQVARTAGFEKRAQYYAAKAYVGQINQGEAYPNLKEIIFIAITDFVMFPDKKEYKSDHVILDKKSFDHNLKDFSFCFLELPKFTKTIDELTTHVEKWAYFFKHAVETSPEDLEKITASDLVISQAYKELNQFFWSEDELNVYEREKKSQMDAKAMFDAATEEGLVKGKAEGLSEGTTMIAKRMLAQGYSIHSIMQLTSLSEKDIKSLESIS